MSYHDNPDISDVVAIVINDRTGSELGCGYGAINGMSLGSGMGGLKQDPEAFGHGLGFGGHPTGNGFGMCVGNHYGGGSGTYRWDENE